MLRKKEADNFTTYQCELCTTVFKTNNLVITEQNRKIEGFHDQIAKFKGRIDLAEEQRCGAETNQSFQITYVQWIQW